MRYFSCRWDAAPSFFFVVRDFHSSFISGMPRWIVNVIVTASSLKSRRGRKSSCGCEIDVRKSSRCHQRRRGAWLVASQNRRYPTVKEFPREINQILQWEAFIGMAERMGVFHS